MGVRDMNEPVEPYLGLSVSAGFVFSTFLLAFSTKGTNSSLPTEMDSTGGSGAVRFS